MAEEKAYTLAEVEKLIKDKNAEYLKVQDKLKAKGLSGEDRNDLVTQANEISRELRRLRDGPLVRAKREKVAALEIEEDRKREAAAKKAEEAKRAEAIKLGKVREESRKAADAKREEDKKAGDKRRALEAEFAQAEKALKDFEAGTSHPLDPDITILKEKLAKPDLAPEEKKDLEKELKTSEKLREEDLAKLGAKRDELEAKYLKLAKALEDLPDAYPVRMRHGYSKADGWEGSYRGRIRVVNGEALARSEREERLLEGRGYVRVASKPGDKALAKKLEPKPHKAAKPQGAGRQK